MGQRLVVGLFQGWIDILCECRSENMKMLSYPPHRAPKGAIKAVLENTLPNAF